MTLVREAVGDSLWLPLCTLALVIAFVVTVNLWGWWSLLSLLAGLGIGTVLTAWTIANRFVKFS